MLLTVQKIFSPSLVAATEEATSGTLSSKWEVIGPGGGGGIARVVIDPHDPAHLLGHSDMSGAYLSKDSGSSWTMFNLWTIPTDFAFAPSNSSIVYASSMGYRHGEDRGAGISILYRSEDGGRNWNPRFPPLSPSVERATMQSSHRLPSQILPEALDASIQRIAIHRRNPNRLAIGCSPLRPYIGPDTSPGPDPPVSFVMFSTDGGRDLKRVGEFTGERIHDLFIEDDGAILAITEAVSVELSTDGTRTVTHPHPAGNLLAAAISRDPETGSVVIYVLTSLENTATGTGGGLYVSRNRGRTWQAANGDLLRFATNRDRLPHIETIGVSRGRPNDLYLSMTVTTNPIVGAPLPWYGIYRSTDGGMHWEPSLRFSGDGEVEGSYEGGWLDVSYPTGWGGSPKHLSVAPSNPMICYATDNGRVYRTLDGGQRWQQIYTNRKSTGAFTSTGLDVTTCYGVHFDPVDQKRFLVSYTDIGLFLTSDGGASWRHAIAGIPETWRNTCYHVVYDPDIAGRAWSAWGRAHDLPREKMFRNPAGLDWAQGGVAISANGGLDWQPRAAGLPERAICTHLLLDPASPPESRTLYACVFGKGVYKSSDGGRRWREASDGLGENRFAWQIERVADGSLILLISRGRTESKTLPGKLFRSGDGALTWQPVSLPDGVDAPTDIKSSPISPRTLLLSSWPNSSSGDDRHGGLYRSDDGGRSWNRLLDERIRVNGIAMDPTNPARIVITTFHNVALQSEDGGLSWGTIEGFDFKWAQRPFFNPHRPEELFITTYGGSVFRSRIPKAR